MGLAFFALTLELPFFAQAKGAYLLMLTGPLALAFGVGFERLDRVLGARFGPAPRSVLHGWLAAFAGALFLAYAG